MRYVIERAITPGEWMVTVHRPDVIDIVHSGTAQECIDWCLAQGAERRGPRVYVKED